MGWLECSEIEVVPGKMGGRPVNTQTQSPEPLAFDVASIKLADLARPGPTYRAGPDVLSMRAWLNDLIKFAYGVDSYQLAGGPAWAHAELYDVQAKAGAVATKLQIRAMTQTLLAERFHLKLHGETRTMSCYLLSVDKNGAKLPPPRTDMPPDSVGPIQMGGGEIWSRGSTIENLARSLGYEVGAPVLDQTGIAGHYEYKLHYDLANHDPAEQPDGAARASATPIAPSIFAAFARVGASAGAAQDAHRNVGHRQLRTPFGELR